MFRYLKLSEAERADFKEKESNRSGNWPMLELIAELEEMEQKLIQEEERHWEPPCNDFCCGTGT